jgi:cysteine desulfurase/selenocysteine lyase
MNVSTLRDETPGCAHVLHFNNAGAGLQPKPVIDAVQRHLDREWVTGGYESEAEARPALDSVYASCARLIGGKPTEIAVVENATRAFDMAFYAVPFKPDDVILTTMTEYSSNFIAYLQVAKHRGAEIRVVPNDEHGQVSVSALREMLSPQVRLVAFAHVPTNNGLVQPAEEVGEAVRGSGALFLLDACQSVGQLPLDVGRIGCDMLSVTSRKFLRGPRGAGFLWVRESLIGDLEPPFLDLHAAHWNSPTTYAIDPTAKRFENWESNIATKLGMGAAADYAMQVGVDRGWERLRGLADLLRAKLARNPRVRLADMGAVRGGIVMFGVKGLDPAAIRDALRARSINVSASFPDYDLTGTLGPLVRASVHYYNTEDEVERFVAELGEVTGELDSRA